MPVDAPPLATRLGKPGDLGRPVADRDQKHSTASTTTQANTRDLAKGHVDHTAHLQLVLVRLDVPHGEVSAGIKENGQSSTTYNGWFMISRSFCSIQFRHNA